MGRASTVGEQLPDSIPVGEITALNTDRFTYYSFFARIEDIIRPRWESQVRSGINRMSRQELSLGPSNRFVTQLTVVLDRNGNFLEAQLLRSSNVPSLDQAASDAFRSARILPNPPQGLIEEDGKVRLNYSFTVFVDPRRIARP
jgi:TonB family protein